MKNFPLPSDRSFGSLFTGVFALLSGLSWWHGKPTAPWLLTVAALFGLTTLIRPTLLHPLNRAWMWLAYILNRVVSPIVLGILYYGLITPIGWIMRLNGRDPMRRRLEPAAASYWQPRQPPGPPPESLRDQF